ncbi:hypothetical protein THTE_3580 [Thermogutta terrifontis]|uniref:Uncharacterized protein n=1 Tax=Thermogutta terrifontis TaxID=1331910 RepID=A0A286RJN7_9BACT|nr:hypothetical protein THTE_3580 [Thermogutta terrifontis]
MQSAVPVEPPSFFAKLVTCRERKVLAGQLMNCSYRNTIDLPRAVFCPGRFMNRPYR